MSFSADETHVSKSQQRVKLDIHRLYYSNDPYTLLHGQLKENTPEDLCPLTSQLLLTKKLALTRTDCTTMKMCVKSNQICFVTYFQEYLPPILPSAESFKRVVEEHGLTAPLPPCQVKSNCACVDPIRQD